MQSGIFLGLDPGMSGGLAVVTPKYIHTTKMLGTDTDVWEWLANEREGWAKDEPVMAVIEQQTPRPTSFFSRSKLAWQASILRSTCVLYGNYMLLRGFLIACRIPFQECSPRKWQGMLSIPLKRKGMGDTEWKNILKSRAQQEFPGVRVTLATSDALLLALVARRVYNGTS